MGNTMKYTELRAYHWMHWSGCTPGRRFLVAHILMRDFRQLPFVSPALNTRGRENWATMHGRRSYWGGTPACQCRIQSWIRGWVPDLSGDGDIQHCQI